MTAIALVTFENSVTIAADGVTYDPTTGKIGGAVAKLCTLPHLDCVFSNTGLGGFGIALQYQIGSDFSSFDELVEHLVPRCRNAYRQVNPWGRLRNGEVRFVIAGWSQKAKAFKAFKLYSHPQKGVQESGEAYDFEAWRLYDIPPGVWASTAPRAAHLEEFGLTNDTNMSAADFAVRAVCACRAQSGFDEDGKYYGVGHFVEVAVVKRGFAQRWIAHSWPDVVGEPIDISRGEPMPPMPVVIP